MSETDLLNAASESGAAPARPANLPEKFWDGGRNAVRIDALLASYLALEKKLSTMLPAAPQSEAERARLHRALGVPARAEDYCVDCRHGLFGPDPDINTRLHAGGFTPEQVQTVYDLAAEKLVPLILDIAAQFEAERELERLERQFGGPERWREVSRQLAAFGRRALPAEALAGLSSSYEGVMALHRMMTEGAGTAGATGSGLADSAGAAQGGGGEKDLHALMRDPRYWRNREPQFVARVTEGFRALYGEGG